MRQAIGMLWATMRCSLYRDAPLCGKRGELAGINLPRKQKKKLFGTRSTRRRWARTEAKYERWARGEA